jgi:hypothetical protein
MERWAAYSFAENAGKTWWQSSRGLTERDILSLQQGHDGVLFAGTNNGVISLTSVSGDGSARV